MRTRLTKAESDASSSHNPWEEMLNSYVDAELGFDEQPVLFTHLAQCSACRRRLDAVLLMRRIVHSEHLEIPPAVDDAFYRRLADYKKRTRIQAPSRPRVFRRSVEFPVSLRVAVSAVVMIFVAGLLMPTDRPYPSRTITIRGDTEQVEFEDEPLTRQEPIYVFYPGLTIEASNGTEPVPVDPL